MTIELNLSLIIAMISIMGTIMSTVIFIMKLRWETSQQEKEITQLKLDINAVGKKIADQSLHDNADMKILLVRIDILDKAIIELQARMGFIKDTMQELKEKLFKSP